MSDAMISTFAALPRSAARYASRAWSGIGAILRKAIRFVVWLLAGYAILVALLIGAYAVLPPVSTLMLGRWLTLRPAERQWVDLDQVSPHLIRAVVTSEDQPFCSHWGVDWLALGGEIDRGLKGRRTFGASTITMQATKNLFLWPSRSYVRKAMEIPMSLALDLAWSKRRLLEVYLNIAEWGPGLFGIEAAARSHFGKSAAQLTRREAALLAAVLPNPILRKPARPSPGVSRKARIIEGRMVATDLACLGP